MKHEIYVLNCIFAVSAAFTFSTYNLWNVMFNWEARKQMIAQMIKEHMPDVVALQEVRVKGLGGESQLTELKQILPHDYKWHIFHTANNVTRITNSVVREWSAEGIGLISRKPILESTTYQLSNDHGPDTNRRIILHAAVKMASSIVVSVIVVHMSYDRQQQCSNAAELLKHITEHKLHNLVILGDFNTYVDFEWPVFMLTGEAGARDKLNPCFQRLGRLFPSIISQVGRFKDVWATIHNGRQTGFTFSNMPTPGYESRPDRILISSNFQVMDVVLSGNGSYYRQHFQGTIHYHRFITIIESAFFSYMGYSGYPCLQDCGPHGSCRCGVCIRGGNQKNCNIPECDECNVETFHHILFLIVILFIVLLHLFISVILILIIGAGSYGNSVYSILGCNCCLLNPKLFFRDLYTQKRRHKFFKLCKLWPIFNLPPYFQLLLAVTMSVIFYFYAKSSLSQIINLVHLAMEEEFFPSDHLMLTVYIE